LYEIKESGNEEKALFAAVTRKHQIEADCVDGGLEAAAAVTMLLDALLSIFLYLCMVRAAPVELRQQSQCCGMPSCPHLDDDCFYYHSWRNNVVIAFGTLSSFLT